MLIIFQKKHYVAIQMVRLCTNLTIYCLVTSTTWILHYLSVTELVVKKRFSSMETKYLESKI